MQSENDIPIHPLDVETVPVSIELLTHKNSYNFHKIHRHDYFEIILTEKGMGKQWIDFREIDLKDRSCYIILPKQVHLLKIHIDSKGTVIQFTEKALLGTDLYGMLRILSNATFFEGNEINFQNINHHIALLKAIQGTKKPFYPASSICILHSLIYHLLGCTSIKPSFENEGLYNRFFQLVESQYNEWHTVSPYLKSLGVSENKLGKITRKHLGGTPLQIIHDRILLEAKRLIFYQKDSIKEISYSLGFKYPSNFSHFIKRKTGLTASQLQNQAKDVNS